MNDKQPLMDYRNARTVMFALFALGFLVGVVGQNEPCIAIGTLIIFSGLMVLLIYYRCPHCGYGLYNVCGRMPSCCPNCGEDL